LPYTLTQHTNVGDALSDVTVLITGIIQESVLGPLMLLIFINELADILAKLGIKVKMLLMMLNSI